MIVRLGSLGSAVALELGKSGVGSFSLIDKDGLDSGNLVRHTRTLDYVGTSKTKLLEEQILEHYPFASVEKHDIFIGQRVEQMEEIVEMAKQSDLIINLTAEESVIHILNRIGTQLEKPMIHGWISNGAWGGRIIKTIPGVTGCYDCYNYSNRIELKSSPDGEIYPRGCGFPTFSGASFDIYGVATQVTSLAVDTLLDKPVTYNHITIQNYPVPKIEVHTFEKDEKCPICGDSGQRVIKKYL